MWKVLFRARRRFDKDQRGNVAVLFAFSMVPLIGLLGGAVDVTRHQRYKVEIAERHGCGGDRARPPRRQERRRRRDLRHTIISRRWSRGPASDPMLHLDALQGDRRSPAATMSTPTATWTPPSCRSSASSRCRSTRDRGAMTGGNYEVALALDNTGSMAEHNKIGALKRRRQSPDRHALQGGRRGRPGEDGARALHHRRQHPRRRLQAGMARPDGRASARTQPRQLRPPVSRLDIYRCAEQRQEGRRRPAGRLEGLRRGARRRPRRRTTSRRAATRRPAGRPISPPTAPTATPRRKTPSWAMQNSYLSDQTGRQGHGARAAAQHRQVFPADRLGALRSVRRRQRAEPELPRPDRRAHQQPAAHARRDQRHAARRLHPHPAGPGLGLARAVARRAVHPGRRPTTTRPRRRRWCSSPTARTPFRRPIRATATAPTAASRADERTGIQRAERQGHARSARR